MSKTEATVFVAAGSLLTGFANCMGLGCHESLPKTAQVEIFPCTEKPQAPIFAISHRLYLASKKQAAKKEQTRII